MKIPARATHSIPIRKLYQKKAAVIQDFRKLVKDLRSFKQHPGYRFSQDKQNIAMAIEHAIEDLKPEFTSEPNRGNTGSLFPNMQRVLEILLEMIG